MDITHAGKFNAPIELASIEEILLQWIGSAKKL
jgi:hypothetical protein